MKTAKQLLSILLTIALLLSLLGTVPIAAADAAKCGDDLTWSWDNSTKTLRISGTGPMWDYTNSEDVPWSFLNDLTSEVAASEIRSLVLDSGITHIGSYAFSCCGALTEVTIPEGVTDIGNNAFELCVNLDKVNFPDSLRTIGEMAFFECQLSQFSLPDGVTDIGSRAFNFCSGLHEAIIPKALEHLGGVAYDTNYVRSVRIDPENPRFYADSSNVLFCRDGSELTLVATFSVLESYTVPAGVTAIGPDAFNSRYQLTDITFPDSLTSIGDFAFYNCAGLESVTLPKNLRSIGETCFHGCDSLRSLRIPDSVTDIGFFAFGYCYGLQEVTLPGSLTEIPDGAFAGCESLKDITLPASLRAIGDEAFLGSSLYDAKLPEGIESVGYMAFASTPLCEFRIPASLVHLGEGAIANCEYIDTVTVAEGNPYLFTDEKNVLYYKNGPVYDLLWAPRMLTAYDIPDGVTNIGECAFFGREKLEQLTLPDSVRIIGASAFEGCLRLKDVELPEGLISIGSEAFRNCLCLDSMTIPAGLSEAGYDVFSGSELKKVTFSEGTILIPFGLCTGCSTLTEVVLPDSVKALDNFAFAGCCDLADIALPDGVTRIGNAAFYGTALKTIALPPALEEIGDSAFEYCDHLTCLDLPASLKQVAPDAFANCGALRDVFYAGTEAQWHEIAGEQESSYTVHFGTTHDCPAAAFLDAPAYSSWAHEGIDWCIEKGLMNGVSSDLFSPNGTVTRAQLVTILYRVADQPKVTASGTFSDVPADRWYTDAIEWAAAEGIVKGVGNGRFDPDGEITREQIATILYRSAGSPEVKGSLDAFPDRADVQPYAADALIWATDSGLINGIKSGDVTSLAPRSSATRAQLASIIMRFLTAE